MSDRLIEQIRVTRARSDFVRAMESVRHDGGVAQALGDCALRPLCRSEIAQLESQGNVAADWSRLQVAEGFDWRKVQNSSFYGDVVLGRFARSMTLADGLELPAGVYRCTLGNCVVGHDALLRDVRFLCNYVVCSEALVLDCGVVECSAGATFGNGSSLALGIQSGGREVAVFAEIDVEVATRIALARESASALAEYGQAVVEYAGAVRSNRAVVGTRALLRGTPRIRNTFIGSHATIDGATLVSDCTILSSLQEPVHVESGACVTNSILQWGSRVSTMAIVERSVLVEHSFVEQHGKVIESVIGPNSGVAKGEVASSLVGPFVGFHHQALLIATLWPAGKGNVSHGANVGANHTSKAPDQEFWPGEGMFLGLGVNIRFPADFTESPYSIVACGVTTPPQKTRFPFALINAPSARPSKLSSTYNQIIPAWVLAEDFYALKRSEAKFQSRNKARRSQIPLSIFRPEIVDLMRDACRRLDAIGEKKEFYTERDIDGLGKNFLEEKDRQSALEAYRFFIRYYALLALKDQVQIGLHARNDGSSHRVLLQPSSNSHWEHARRILAEELGIRNVVTGLRQLPSMLEKIGQAVERPKAKDDERGVRIIADYAVVHPTASQDIIVQQTWKETRRLQFETKELLALLEAVRPPDRQAATGAAEDVKRLIGLQDGEADLGDLVNLR
jgi:hypothetical protein